MGMSKLTGRSAKTAPGLFQQLPTRSSPTTASRGSALPDNRHKGEDEQEHAPPGLSQDIRQYRRGEYEMHNFPFLLLMEYAFAANS